MKHRLTAIDPRRHPPDWDLRQRIAGTICAWVVTLTVLGYVVLEATGVLYALYKPLQDLERAAQTAGQVQEETRAYRLAVEKWKASNDAKDEELRRERAENKQLTEQNEALKRAHAAEIRAVKRTEK